MIKLEDLLDKKLLQFVLNDDGEVVLKVTAHNRYFELVLEPKVMRVHTGEHTKWTNETAIASYVNAPTEDEIKNAVNFLNGDEYANSDNR